MSPYLFFSEVWSFTPILDTLVLSNFLERPIKKDTLSPNVNISLAWCPKSKSCFSMKNYCYLAGDFYVYLILILIHSWNWMFVCAFFPSPLELWDSVHMLWRKTKFFVWFSHGIKNCVNLKQIHCQLHNFFNWIVNISFHVWHLKGISSYSCLTDNLFICRALAVQKSYIFLLMYNTRWRFDKFCCISKTLWSHWNHIKLCHSLTCTLTLTIRCQISKKGSRKM